MHPSTKPLKKSHADTTETQIFLLQNKKPLSACVILCTALQLDLKASPQKSGHMNVERDACAMWLLVSLIELS